jgi:hypothetical protein
MRQRILGDLRLIATIVPGLDHGRTAAFITLAGMNFR